MALQKLRKLRETIRQLPATGQRQELVEAVKEHPVVLVAGAREKICEDLKDVDGLVMVYWFGAEKFSKQFASYSIESLKNNILARERGGMYDSFTGLKNRCFWNRPRRHWLWQVDASAAIPDGGPVRLASWPNNSNQADEVFDL